MVLQYTLELLNPDLFFSRLVVEHFIAFVPKIIHRLSILHYSVVFAFVEVWVLFHQLSDLR